MTDNELLQAIRTILKEEIETVIAPLRKEIEDVKLAVLDINQQLIEIKRDIADLKAVVASNAYEIALLKTKVS